MPVRMCSNLQRLRAALASIRIADLKLSRLFMTARSRTGIRPARAEVNIDTARAGLWPGGLRPTTASGGARRTGINLDLVGTAASIAIALVLLLTTQECQVIERLFTPVPHS
jgi:hypothetical protein